MEPSFGPLILNPLPALHWLRKHPLLLDTPQMRGPTSSATKTVPILETGILQHAVKHNGRVIQWGCVASASEKLSSET